MIVVDRRPEMALYPRDLPWLHKPAAVRAAARTSPRAPSTSAASSATSTARATGRDPARPSGNRRVHNRASGSRPPRADRRRSSRRLLAPGRHRRAGAGLSRRPCAARSRSAAFVFVSSDFIAPTPLAAWMRAVEQGWDVCPVIIQDPAGSRASRRSTASSSASSTPRGRTRRVRLSADEVAGGAAQRGAAPASLRDFFRLGLDPSSSTMRAEDGPSAPRWAEMLASSRAGRREERPDAGSARRGSPSALVALVGGRGALAVARGWWQGDGGSYAPLRRARQHLGQALSARSSASPDRPADVVVDPRASTCRASRSPRSSSRSASAASRDRRSDGLGRATLVSFRYWLQCMSRANASRARRTRGGGRVPHRAARATMTPRDGRTHRAASSGRRSASSRGSRTATRSGCRGPRIGPPFPRPSRGGPSPRLPAARHSGPRCCSCSAPFPRLDRRSRATPGGSARAHPAHLSPVERALCSPSTRPRRRARREPQGARAPRVELRRRGKPRLAEEVSGSPGRRDGPSEQEVASWPSAVRSNGAHSIGRRRARAAWCRSRGAARFEVRRCREGRRVRSRRLLIVAPAAAPSSPPAHSRAGASCRPNAGVVVLDVSSSVQPEDVLPDRADLATIARRTSASGSSSSRTSPTRRYRRGRPRLSSAVAPLLRAPSATDRPTRGRAASRTPWDQWFSAAPDLGRALPAGTCSKQNVKHELGHPRQRPRRRPDRHRARRSRRVAYLQQQDIPLEIVGLNPRAQDVEFCRGLLGEEAILRPRRCRRAPRPRGKIAAERASRRAARVRVLTSSCCGERVVGEPLRWRRTPA